MIPTKKCRMAFLMILILAPGARGQSGGSRLLAKTEKPAMRTPATTEEMEALREALAAQQRQIEELKSAMQRLQQMLQQPAAAHAPGNGRLALTGTAGNPDANAGPAMAPESAVPGSAEAAMEARMQADEKRLAQLEQPAQIHFRGITITPGGY
ncbi:MAG TPA: hypothetical protein VHM88_07040, partial [Candidatus Acidoferrales bacterium]|nr:hypothetical protein [Candidatus Acidoferrales bacterium]